MQLIEYNDITKLLDLNIEDKDFDELCLNAAYSEVQKQIGYTLEFEEKCENLTVKDNRVILDCINLVKVTEIYDLTKKYDITNFTVDFPNKSIYFVPCKADEHQILVTYESGYTKESLPADLKEAIIQLFLYKQQSLRSTLNNSDSTRTIPEEIKQITARYNRKSL